MDYMFGNQECSSGCESGWTLYLQHSSISPDASYDRELDSPNRVFAKRSNDEEEDEDEDEDEDLSMVSDASSGPPHLHEEEEGCDRNGCSSFYPYAIEEALPRNINLLRKKKRENRCRNKAQQQQHSSLLDDTASSPFLNLCNKTRSQASGENVVEYSQGYSTTQFEERERAPYEEGLYDFFQSGNQLQQQNHRWFEGKRW